MNWITPSRSRIGNGLDWMMREKPGITSDRWPKASLTKERIDYFQKWLLWLAYYLTSTCIGLPWQQRDTRQGQVGLDSQDKFVCCVVWVPMFFCLDDWTIYGLVGIFYLVFTHELTLHILVLFDPEVTQQSQHAGYPSGTFKGKCDWFCLTAKWFTLFISYSCSSHPHTI